jgi:hypothetical protein
MKGSSRAANYTVFKPYFEFKTNEAYGYEIAAFDWDANVFVPLASGTTAPDVEVGLEPSAPPPGGSRQPFVRASDRLVRLRLSFSGVNSAFRARVDRVEVRTR